MSATLSTGRATFKYAPPASARDPKIGDVGHRLRDIGFSDTPGGAMARARRALNDLLVVASTAMAEEDASWLDELLAPLDELRVAGHDVELGAAALNTIQSADSLEDCARVRFHNDPTLDHARALLQAALKQARTSFELVRGLRSKYPELAR